MKLELRKIGEGTGVVLPKELLLSMSIAEGDAVYAVRDGKGGVILSPYDPEFARVMEIGDEILDEFEETFRDLAK
jgi:putative addiction module antidote